ncbi:MAG TPA: glycosyltransferase family 87 protein [Candidatus Sulfotelmatobacter sp.]|nr:glycosyltransferase family 87 protein [Candidatus Sulfotelmatobacter sp.]
MTSPAPAVLAWINSAANWLTPNRIRAQAFVLAVCLWGVCAVDFATPGLFDRAGNIKFQDFLQFYISARLINQGRSSQLFDQRVADQEMHAIVREQTRVQLPTVYGPQVGLLFAPLARLSFPAAACIWVALSLLAVAACLYLLWRSCPALRWHASSVAICAAAFPPLFHFFVRGQISALLLLCVSAAFLAFRADRDWLAGIALGCLVFKPQFLVAIPLILLLAQAWKALAGLVLAAAGQLALTAIYFGTAVMRLYFNTMLHISRWVGVSEIGAAHIQMHSLRSFWTLLLPWPTIALGLYVVTSIAAIAIAAAIWKSSSALAVRFSALILASVLVNPHLFIYDLLVLAPAFLLLVDWILRAQPESAPLLHVLLYLSFMLPLLGPLSRWTHLQLSVLAFAALLWLLWRDSKIPIHKFASNQPAVV